MHNSLKKLDIFINYKCSHYFILKIVLVYRTVLSHFQRNNSENLVYKCILCRVHDLIPLGFGRDVKGTFLQGLFKLLLSQLNSRTTTRGLHIHLSLN